MFAPERLRVIKGTLVDKKHIDVSTLSSMLGVSEVTIRRDLERLESENFLTRAHGGAILNEQSLEEDYNDFHDDPFIKDRLEISEIASHMIADNDIIILSSGPTNLCIAKKILNKKNVTVLTNDLNIACELSSNATTNVIVPGGDLDFASMSLLGKLTETNIKSFFVNKAFIEVEGVSMERGYTVQGIDRASIIIEMSKITTQCILICHYKAFNYNAFSQVGPINMVKKIITNPKLPDQYKKYFFENNIQLFTAFNAYEGGV